MSGARRRAAFRADPPSRPDRRGVTDAHHAEVIGGGRKKLRATIPARHGRRSPLQDRLRIRAARRPAQGDRRAHRRAQTRRQAPDAARHYRLGQDLYGRLRDRGHAAADLDHGAQQDAGGAALRRVQGALPRERGRVLRQLLRLLPARSVRRRDRHVHREGLAHQRADRSHAPRGDALGALASRRHHRRLGVVHLRHRRSQLLPRPRRRPRRRPGAAPRRALAPPRRHPVRAQRRRLPPRHLPRARRHRRGLRRATKKRPRCASSSSATRSRTSARSIRCAARSRARRRRRTSSPRRTT